MFSILISVFLGSLSTLIAGNWINGIGWVITIGVCVFLTSSILLNRIFGKKLSKIVDQVQELLKESQQETMRMVNRFQNKPVGTQKLMESRIEKVVEAGVMKALELLETTKPLYKWGILAERQICTLKMQLNFQIKRFEEADKLMPKILAMEPMTLAMKMTRQYHLKSPELEKSFNKGKKKFKNEKGILIYSLYAWILIKRKQNQEALEVLAEAKEKSEDENIHRNWQHVANNKAHLFSNSGLGEQWFALHLDKPPKQKASKGQMKRNPMMPKRRRKQF